MTTPAQQLHDERCRIAARAWTLPAEDIPHVKIAMGIGTPQPLTHPHSTDAGHPWSPWGSIAETET
jgi:hypothetical protein